MNRWNLLVLPSLAIASFAVPATAQNRRPPPEGESGQEHDRTERPRPPREAVEGLRRSRGRGCMRVRGPTGNRRRSVRNAATSAKRRSNGLYASRRTARSRPGREPWRRPIAAADSGVAIGQGERDAAAT